MSMSAEYQQGRARDLGYAKEGVGKRYNFADLQRFIIEAGKLYEKISKPRKVIVNFEGTENGPWITSIEGMSMEDAARRLVIVRQDGSENSSSTRFECKIW